MNNNQREIIAYFLKTILEDGVSGDIANCYNHAISFVREIKETDAKLNTLIHEVEYEFENS